MSFPASRFLISSARIERLTLIAVLLVQAVLCAMCPARAAKADSPGSCPSPFSKNFPGVLEFGMPSHEGVPGGWTGMPQGTVSLMPKAALHGHRIVQIDRTKDSPSKFSYISLCIPVDFTGKTITFHGFLSTGNVNGFAGLWLREDAGGSAIAFDNMQGKNLNGTTKWKDYAVTLPIKPQAEKVVFGVLLSGTGKVQSSNLRLLVDGKPIWKAHETVPKKTVLDTDHQFDLGSRIDIKTLGPTQIENLARLGKVWGFLKYYDPVVTTGRVQWDYELFRILPKILAAKDKAAADDVLAKWIAKLGPVPHCHPCAHLETKDIQLRPDLAWIDEAQDIGKALSDRLRWIRRNRNKSGQFYVALSFPGGNPVFKHELPYTSIKFPDSGFQLLALYRFWNMIEYWYPYRNVVGENWDKVLTDFIPRLALAKSRKQYILQMMALIAKIHDTHANLWSALNERPPVGKCHLPVRIRFVGYQPVVTGYLGKSGPGSSPLRIGDVVTELDGKAVSLLIGKWTPYYGASNQAALRREIATFMTRGSCGEMTVAIRRNGQAMELKTRRVPIPNDYWFGTNDLPGPAFRMLSPQVAYLKISAAKKSRMADYIKRAASSRGLIIDMRGYPSSNDLMPGQHMIERTTPFSRFTVGDLATPGAFHWQPPQSLQPDQPHYSGKVVIIVDSLTQSYSEYTSMDLRAAGAIVVGSTTAGADGDLSHIPLPGGLSTAISGLGVFYPDKQPTQRIGIIPDFVVRPTVASIRTGDDPVLDKAIRLIVGPKVPLKKIEAMYHDNGRTAPNKGHGTR